MMWTDRERLTLTGLGLLGLAGMALLLWQRQTPAIVIAGSATPIPAAPWSQALEMARQVDVNTAGVAELERLPQIGPMLAKRIVAYRTTHGAFRMPHEIARVPGIGPKTAQALEGYISVEGSE